MVGNDRVHRGDVVDKGLQIERTRLSWKRTVLNMTVFSILALRILPMCYATWGLIVGVIGVAITAIACMEYRRRSSFYTVWFVHVDAIRKTASKPDDDPVRAITLPTRERLGSDGSGLLAIAAGISICSVICLLLALFVPSAGPSVISSLVSAFAPS
ncbi:DUF202 domain-containing protein [Bifidobacterium simiarum]|uniref:DUF202 domain-containing protein n=1 Tax=Bifidobacterium simiarum TaxID=2045441 RepID=UPI001BDD186D|nr:DUF202 domain-containing protein [Bifidobacterium simiarum]MBT1166943.1 DUF202 domain-containing protein [Bifidobacterium simiarum]